MAWQQKFSHIYIEKEAYSYPMTKLILEKESKAIQIPIDHHKDVFNPRGQRFSLQKLGPKLILAVKKGRFIYQGTERINSWNKSRLFYTDPVRNCLFDCSYCFLQGMHNSAHILIYVNQEDYFRELDKLAKEEAKNDAQKNNGKQKGAYLSFSYLSDILAFEELFPFTKLWMEKVEEFSNIDMEIRTKSDFFRALAPIPAPKNTILVWSLSNDFIARTEEKGTAHFRNRLIAAKQAQDAGWRVRICFDPIILYENWKEDSKKMITECFRWLDPKKLEEISIGSFRMGQQYFRHIQTNRLSTEDFKNDQGIIGYSNSAKEEIKGTLIELLSDFVDVKKLFWVEG